MEITIDTTNLCSHLQKKLSEPETVYYPIWQGSAENAILMWAMRMLWTGAQFRLGVCSLISVSYLAV